jgi:hypothetical protein
MTALIDGTLSREAATSWAMRWVFADARDVDDPVVWRGLNGLVHADAPLTEHSYLFQQVDFEAWRDALDNA